MKRYERNQYNWLHTLYKHNLLCQMNRVWLGNDRVQIHSNIQMNTINEFDSNRIKQYNRLVELFDDIIVFDLNYLKNELENTKDYVYLCKYKGVYLYIYYRSLEEFIKFFSSDHIYLKIGTQFFKQKCSDVKYNDLVLLYDDNDVKIITMVVVKNEILSDSE